MPGRTGRGTCCSASCSGRVTGASACANLRSTDYLNTIAPDAEPAFPGDEHIERRIRAYIRWNAAIMVHRAQRPGIGVGGHISTYASAAALYEVGFNHFFRGHDARRRRRPDLLPGPRLTGHLRPRVPGRTPDQQTNSTASGRRSPTPARAAGCRRTRTRG